MRFLLVREARPWLDYDESGRKITDKYANFYGVDLERKLLCWFTVSGKVPQELFDRAAAQGVTVDVDENENVEICRDIPRKSEKEIRSMCWNLRHFRAEESDD